MDHFFAVQCPGKTHQFFFGQGPEVLGQFLAQGPEKNKMGIIVRLHITTITLKKCTSAVGILYASAESEMPTTAKNFINNIIPIH